MSINFFTFFQKNKNITNTIIFQSHFLYTFVRKNNKYNYGTTSFYTKGNKRLFT